MTLNIDPAFEGKLTCALKSDMRNLANFQQSTFECLKVGTLGKCMSLKFTEKFCAMTMKNVGKLEEELTCQIKIDMRNLTNLDPGT